MEKYRNQTSNLTQLIGPGSLFEMTFEEWLSVVFSQNEMCAEKIGCFFGLSAAL